MGNAWMLSSRAADSSEGRPPAKEQITACGNYPLKQTRNNFPAGALQNCSKVS
jgi:hypothetical protein